MAAINSPSGCIVPGCEATFTRLYPGGRLCDDHKPLPGGRQA